MSSGPTIPPAVPATVSPPVSQNTERRVQTPPTLTEEERAEATRLVWSAPAEMGEPPGPETVLPQFKAPGIRIECVSRQPIDTLARRVQTCRERQQKERRMLASTFCHGGSLFLVFKHWPHSAHPFPRST